MVSPSPLAARGPDRRRADAARRRTAALATRGAPPARQRAGLPERLIEAVWGAERPNTIGAALNVHLSKIRKLLAAVGARRRSSPSGTATPSGSTRSGSTCIASRSRSGGARALAAGRSRGGRGPTGRSRLGGGRRRGPRARRLRRRCLRPLRRAAPRRLEDRFEAGLQLGRHAELVPEIEEPVREHRRSASAPEDS